eukprot:6205587-Pleurochrysis_carterae.AAC.2
MHVDSVLVAVDRCTRAHRPALSRPSDFEAVHANCVYSMHRVETAFVRANAATYPFQPYLLGDVTGRPRTV